MDPILVPDIRRSWATTRQILYGVALVLIFIGILTAWYRFFIYEEPTCFDGKQNSEERGVDCGGSCERVCVPDVIAPTIQWAKAFKVQDGMYHAVAYVINDNKTAGTKSIPYTLTLEDESGVITKRTGNIYLPPDGVYPIFEGRIETGTRVPTVVRVSLDPQAAEWIPLASRRDDYTTLSRTLENSGTSFPTLTAGIQNNLYTDERDLRVVGVVYDSSRNPLVVSQTVVHVIRARDSAQAVFTWPHPIAGTIRSCVVPSDVVMLIDRSGSMAADGGTPPEPLESAKSAASSFVQSLGANDRVALITYATTPALDSSLSDNHRHIQETIMNLTLHKDGIQYTDLSAALKTATAEILSERHNADARQVLVLMTDGDVTRPVNPATGKRDIVYAENQARKVAEEAKQAGIIVYTIGFGKLFDNGGYEETNRNMDLVKELATDADHSFFAPTITELERVYESISQGLCEDGPAIIDVLVVPEAE